MVLVGIEEVVGWGGDVGDTWMFDVGWEVWVSVEEDLVGPAGLDVVEPSTPFLLFRVVVVT